MNKTPQAQASSATKKPSMAMTVLRIIGIVLGVALVIGGLWIAFGGYKTLMLYDNLTLFGGIGFGLVFGSILVYVNSHALLDQRLTRRR